MARKKKQPVTLATSSRITLAKGIVDDPYEPGAKLRVVKNVREHPVALLHHTGRISESQRIVGELFRAKYERAVIGAQGSIDYAKERVDGGQLGDPLSVAAQEAAQWLNDCARYSGCGKLGYTVLTHVCGEGRGIQETARLLRGSGAPGGRAGDGYVLGVLVTALEALIQHLGMEAVGRRRR